MAKGLKTNAPRGRITALPSMLGPSAQDVLMAAITAYHLPGHDIPVDIPGLPLASSDRQCVRVRAGH